MEIRASHFWVLIPSPSPDVWAKEKEKTDAWGAQTGKRSHPGWHWILLENFGYTLLCWSVAMPAEMVFSWLKISWRARCGIPQETALAVLKGMHRGQIPLEWGLQASGIPFSWGLGLHLLCKVHDLGCMGISYVWVLHLERPPCTRISQYSIFDFPLSLHL